MKATRQLYNEDVQYVNDLGLTATIFQLLSTCVFDNDTSVIECRCRRIPMRVQNDLIVSCSASSFSHIRY